MMRADAIRDALDRGQQQGIIGGWYCSAPGDRGRRWTVWGRAVGAYETEAGRGAVGVAVSTLAIKRASSAERTYSTRDIESMLRAVGLLRS